MLVDLPVDPSQSAETIALPTLKELEKKILVKVKRAASKPAETDPKPTTLQAPAPEVRKSTSVASNVSTSTSSSEEVPEAVNKPPAPKAKITEALGKLGIYTGAYHFKSFDQPGL